jgi:hypothetical protein
LLEAKCTADILVRRAILDGNRCENASAVAGGRWRQRQGRLSDEIMADLSSPRASGISRWVLLSGAAQWPFA